MILSVAFLRGISACPLFLFFLFLLSTVFFPIFVVLLFAQEQLIVHSIPLIHYVVQCLADTLGKTLKATFWALEMSIV